MHKPAKDIKFNKSSEFFFRNEKQRFEEGAETQRCARLAGNLCHSNLLLQPCPALDCQWSQERCWWLYQSIRHCHQFWCLLLHHRSILHALRCSINHKEVVLKRKSGGAFPCWAKKYQNYVNKIIYILSFIVVVK